jgi:diguanylate cyclase (GGDEF)-like protein/PAS domain S-box-containing protein
MDKTFIIDLVYNITLLLSLGLIYTVFQKRLNIKIWVLNILLGISVGLVGLLVMTMSVHLTSGTIFDARSVLMSVTGMFFGLIPTLIAGAIMTIYRITIGGAGVYAGILSIITTGAIGVFWHYYRLDKIVKKKSTFMVEFYLFGILTHITMLLCMFAFPFDQAISVLKAITLPVILLYPIGVYLLSILLVNQLLRKELMLSLKKSESLFNQFLEHSPIYIYFKDQGMRMVKLSKNFETMTGKPLKELIGKTTDEIFPPDMAHRINEDDNQVFKNGNIVQLYEEQDGKTFLTTKFPIKIDNETHYMAGYSLDISERINREKEILFLSYHDPLTGLYNRRFYEEEILKIDVEANLPISIIIGDVNGMKLINDSFGHYEGDQLLIKATKAINENLRVDDVVIRWAGDEFVIILPKTTEIEAEVIMSKINKTCEAEYIKAIQISVSFGVETKKYESQSIEKLLIAAEKNMYKNKIMQNIDQKGNVINTIINTLHEKNQREELHSKRVSEYSVKLAKAMAFSEIDVSKIKIAGMLHDIGKIALEEGTLNKQTTLTDSEWEDIKRHPEIGYRIIGSSYEMIDIAEYTLSHHERWDGRGYPKGLIGEEIPKIARIIGIADAYDAMTSARTYRKILSKEEAIVEIEKNRGTQFDPEIAKIFIEKVLKTG